MLILALDTTSRIASAALCRDGDILAECEKDSQMNHSKTILPLVEQMLKDKQIKMSEIDVFAAAVGPGSFTGVRIGIAAIKGYAWALQKPCAGVSTLKAAAYSAIDHEGTLCAVVKARADEFFYAIYENKNGTLKTIFEDAVESAAEILEKLSGFKTPVTLCGDGAEDFLTFCEKKEGLKVSDSGCRQNARAVALCADLLAKENKLISANELTPSYLRLSQAEQMKQKGLIK